MSALDIFRYDGTDVRVEPDEIGDPWFLGSDVTRALGYANPSDALARLDADDRRIRTLALAEGSRMVTRERTFVNEAGVYQLIFGSSLPDAHRFRRWVTHEVLPSIRKTGGYQIQHQLPQTFAEALRELASTVEAKEALEAKVAADAPKVLFADSVATSDSTVLVGDLAKILRSNGANLGATRLFARLREDGYLIKRRGADWNMPTQRSMELGLFRIKETAVTHSDGHVTVSKTPKVTGKGQTYFVNRYSPIRTGVSA